MVRMGALHHRLHGGLWHVTHPCRFKAIIVSGGLRVEPDIPNSERWASAKPEDYPFVRSISGISLFEFSGFDPESYEQKFPLSNWYEFVPHRADWGGAVWIEIDRVAVSHSLLSANELRKRWDQDGQRHRKRMPEIETAHVGDLPSTAFRSAFLTWQGGRATRDIDLAGLSSFDLLLAEWKDSL